MSVDRFWMYRRLKDGFMDPGFVVGVEEFIEFARNHIDGMDGNRLRCPCNKKKCRNLNFEEVDTVKMHLYRHGFVEGYYTWTFHGESEVSYSTGQGMHRSHDDGIGSSYEGESSNAAEQMVYDAAGPQFEPDFIEENPNATAQQFYDMLSSANQHIWNGNTTHSQLSVVARLLHIKSEERISEKGYNDLCQLISELLPADHVMPSNFYDTKKLVRGIGLPVEQIDSCVNGCMIYWREDNILKQCKFCNNNRYRKKKEPYKRMFYFPLTPRLQRLYASKETAEHMRWHSEHDHEDDVMRHCSDSTAWKHFNTTHPEFASEIRNVRLGLCTDGFQPFGQSGRQYSCWPVILTPYNLPPWMCMKDPYMFLTIIVPGPRNPKEKLDVYLQPLISELISLWSDGIDTYDISMKQNFVLKAALLWTISDFPAYAMLSGWSTAGRLACPYCMDKSEAFTLKHGKKQSWFDNHRKFLPMSHRFRRNKHAFKKNCIVTTPPPIIRSGNDILREIEELGLKKVTEIDHVEVNSRISRISGWRKRSIFWDLPYWKTNLIRHNLDVMHIEKKNFDNIFNTVMNVDGKTKDNAKSRRDLMEICRRPELHPINDKFPKASYMLSKQQIDTLCEWVKNLRFPDGYASNLARCVDMHKHRLFGMKSHDCHVFMQRLLPIAFRELLPGPIWQALTEVSLFFKDISSTNLQSNDMTRLEEEIPVILCKLEQIFPPSFFDSMEHLPVHLAYEAKIAGLVQYRWMYPFERYLKRLKNNVRNKARVEGSICNAYLVEETTSFCSHYFDPNVHTRHKRMPRNVEHQLEEDPEDEGNISIFTHPGRSLGQHKAKILDDTELFIAHQYILLNCSEVKPFIEIFLNELQAQEPNLNDADYDKMLEQRFPDWFTAYARDNIDNIFLKALADGPLKTACSYNGYYANGFRFHTEQYGSSRATFNSGVCIKGSNYTMNETDYYGRLVDVIELEYPGWPIKRTVLFKCKWFDITENVGIRIHKQYKLIDVNHTRTFRSSNPLGEPFVLAMQVSQVYYVSYPSLKRDTSVWWGVCKMKARGLIEMPEESNHEETTEPFQNDSHEDGHFEIVSEIESIPLDDPTAGLVDMEDDDIEVNEDDLESDDTYDDDDDCD